MKTLHIRIILLTILITTLAYSAFTTYQLIIIQERNKILMDYIISQTDLPIALIGDMANDISYLLNINASRTLVNTKLHFYLVNIRTLTYSSMMLYESTMDEKYMYMRTAMKNLESFLLTVINSQDTNKYLRNNMDKIKEISSIIKNLATIEDITLVKAKKLLELTNSLKA